MATRSLHTLVGHLRRAVGPPRGGEVSDARLLERWVDLRDEAAFELLVWRHGPLVLAACRRLLRDGHAAEDAFQATWLVFVRKAGAIRRGEAVAAWLHRVACRVALRARAAAARRAAREGQAQEVAAPAGADEAALGDLRAVLDEEVDRLPEHYRRAFVLCALEGKTQEEAARLLGRPRGTLSAWLTRARGCLRRRLARRGVAPGAALAGLMVSDAAAPAMPGPLLGATVRAAVGFAAGGAVPAMLSREVAALVEGVLEGSAMAKMKVAALVLVLLAGAGAAALFGQAPGGDRPSAPPVRGTEVVAAKPRPDADAADDGVAWGKTAGGLRAGIGIRPGDRRTYRSDDSVTLVVSLRNVGGKAVRLSYPETLFAEWMPAVQDADGFPVAVAPGPVKLGDVPVVRRSLEPGEQITLGYPWFRVRPPAWRGPVLGPTLRTGPGKYRVSYAGLPLRLGGAGPTSSGPPTGWVELEIEPDGGLRADRVVEVIAPTRTEDAVQEFFVNRADFKIPFDLDKARHDIREVNLYYSDDKGATWELSAKANPADRAFTFRAPRDGVYWFTVQAVDRAGRAEPPDLAKVPPMQKVCVDTKAPQGKLCAEWQGRALELRWAVSDENLDLATLQLAYREAGEETWHWLELPPPKAEGKVRLRPATDGEMEVRLRVKDRAGNEAAMRGTVKARNPE
jgi:RNA polymerase sigma factor (sigma-70 family)